MWTRRAHKNTKKPLRTINQRPQNSKKNPEPAEFPSPSPEDGRTSRKGTFFGVEVITGEEDQVREFDEWIRNKPSANDWAACVRHRKSSFEK